MVPETTRREWRKHLGHIEPIYQCECDLYNLAKTLNPGKNKHFKYTLVKLFVDYMLYSIDETNRMIVMSLESGAYSVAESLARTSSEYSSNLIYVIEGDSNLRAKSLLKDFYNKSKINAEKWLEYAESTVNEDEIYAAKVKVAMVNKMMDVDFLHASKWPGSQAKFKAINLEHFYHHTFAPASNSTHSLSEDIYQLFLRERMVVVV
ncbi:hypothetical protein C6H60_17685 [Vibrio cholerae]